MIITRTSIVPTSDRIDEARRIERLDHCGKIKLGGAKSWLAPAFVVDDLKNKFAPFDAQVGKTHPCYNTREILLLLDHDCELTIELRLVLR